MIPDFGESDVLHLNLPLKEILSTSLKNREWPLWTPYLANGFPILAEGQIGTFYLPNLLLFRFLPMVTAYNLNLVIAFLLAGIGCIFFFRNIGFSRLSGLYAALIFTFSGFLSVHLNHFNLLQAASLLPLIFWSSYRIWNKPNFPNAILLAFFVSQQIFTGHFYIVFITLVGISIFWTGLVLFREKMKQPSNSKYKIIYLVFGLIIALFLSAIQLVPTTELHLKSGRESGLPFETITSYPYPARHLLTFVKPYAFGNPREGTYPPFDDNWGIFWENTAYIGIIPLLLAVFSLIYLKEKLVKAGFLLFALSILLVLGKYSPVYFIFSIPPFNLFRVPSKFLLLTTFSLSILASYTLGKIINRLSIMAKAQKFAIAKYCAKYASYIFIIIVLLSVILDEYRFSYKYPPTTPSNWWFTPEVVNYLKEKEGRIASIGAPTFWNSVFLPKGWKDMTPYVYFKNSLYPNYNALFSIPNADINTGGLIPRRVAFLKTLGKEINIDEKDQIASISASVANILSLQNVTYLISPYRIENPSFEKIKTIDPDPALKLNSFLIYKNSKVFPRAYIAYKTKLINTLDDFYREISEENYLNKKMALVEDNRFLIENHDNTIGNVRIINIDSQNITLETDSGKEGILVLADTYYPGWYGYLDGKEVETFTVNLTQRGILLPQGQHKIHFIFVSKSFLLGKSITQITGITVFLAVFLYRVFFPHITSCNKRLLRHPYNKENN